MEPGGSLPRSQDTETCPCPKRDQSIPRLFSCLLLRLPSGLLALTFPYHNSVYTSPPLRAKCPANFCLTDSITGIIFGELLPQSPPIPPYALPLTSKCLIQHRNMQKRSETVQACVYISKERLLASRMNNFTSDTSPLCYDQQIYSGTPVIRINWAGQPSGYAEIPDNWIFL
jgi:hypothetical protein